MRFNFKKTVELKRNFFCFIILFISIFQNGSAVSEQIAAAVIEIDFSQPVKVNSMSGFLHSASIENPSNDLIAPLKPKQWRTGERNPGVIERIKKSGARPQIVLSDFWGYPGLNTKRRWVYETGSEFEDFVRETARAYHSKEIIWDIWNEPDDSRLPFWKGTFEQFCETYLRAYKILRQELGPDVMIGGPSFSRYNQPLLKRFLDFCVANGCEVNFLSWHELDDRKISGIADRVSDARRLFLENQAYKNLKIKEIQINEIIGSRAQNSPGAIAGYFYYLEKGKADGAAKACWENSAGDYNCYNNTLDGLLKADGDGSFLPTAAWWVYKIYADGAESRVSSVTTNPQIVALGSTRSDLPNCAQILVGYFRESASQPIRANISLNLKNLNSLPFVSESQKATIKIEKIPDTGERAVRELDLIKEETFSLSNNSLQITIENAAVNDVYRLTISKSP